MVYKQVYKLTALYNVMLFINLSAIHAEVENSKNLMVSAILYKPCRKNISQHQSKDNELLIDIFTFNKITYDFISMKDA